MSPRGWKRLSDERLGRRLAEGDAAAFDELYRRYVHRLAAYGGHLLGDLAAGEDVSHTALLKAYQALRAGHGPERVRPWLYRIARNAAIDALARRRELLRADAPERIAGDPHEQALLRGALVAAIAGLPERQRRAYVLRELNGLRLDEIAAELGLTSQQVEQALFAARSRLAEVIVFGGKLRCDVVRRLAEGELHRAERRALKGHLRTCPSCRAAIGSRAAVAVLPLPALEWLRGAVAGLAGGSSAAKVGAVVATATIATGAPIAIHDEVQRRTQVEATARKSASPAAIPRVASARSFGSLAVPRAPVLKAAERPGSGVGEDRGHGSGRAPQRVGDAERDRSGPSGRAGPRDRDREMQTRENSGPGSDDRRILEAAEDPPDRSAGPEAAAEAPSSSSGPGSGGSIREPSSGRGDSGSSDRSGSSSGSSGPGSGNNADEEPDEPDSEESEEIDLDSSGPG